MIPSFFLHLLLLPFSPRTLSSMKSSALLYTILWSISGCDVREAFLLQLKTGSFLLFPKIETSMEMNVPLCEYEDDGWDDMQATTLSNSYCKKTVCYKEEDLELIK
jgi:hypothetical protein